MPHIYYHVTPQDTLPSIEIQGLIPQSGDRSAIRHDPPAIYLFPSLDALHDALMNWLGDLFDEDTPLALLRICVPATWPIRVDPQTPWEVRCEQVIPPQNLSYLGDA